MAGCSSALLFQEILYPSQVSVPVKDKLEFSGRSLAKQSALLPLVTNTPPLALENSKTSKHKTKPTFKTYHFHLMPIIYMSSILQPTQDESKEVCYKGREELQVTWELDLLRLYKQEKPGDTREGEVHYQTE